MATRGGGLQAGGLAAAVGVDEEDPLDAAVTTPAEIIEEAKQPKSYGELAREASKMSRDKALQRLQRGYDELSQQKFDQSQKWLAAAQGFLAPTRTGGFGESLGAAAGALQEPLTQERKFEMERATRLAQMEEEMAGAEEAYAEREIDILGEEERARTSSYRGNLKDIYIADPDNPNETIRVMGAFNQDTRMMEPVPTSTGEGYARRPDDLDPWTRFQLAQAGERGKLGVKNIDADLTSLKVGKQRLAGMYRGLDLLEQIKDEGGTSGFQAMLQKMREFLGSEADDVQNRGELMALMGDQLFNALDSFGTQINERELMTAKDELAAGATRSTAVNEALLQQLTQKLEAEVLNTREMVKEFGDDQQIRTAMMPLVNYNLSEGMVKRASDLGIRMHKHVPFGEEDTVDLAARSEGEKGTMKNPHAPVTAAEFNDMLTNKEDYDIRSSDYIMVPGDPPTLKRIP